MKINFGNRKKLQAIQSLSANIAHEFRTPLRSIISYTEGLQKYLPDLIEAYKKAKEANLDISQISPRHFRAIQEALNGISLEAQQAFIVIDMLMVTTGMAKNTTRCEPDQNLAISHCVNTALARYPFESWEQALIHWPAENNALQDFNFFGKESLLIHIIFNLLKNAFYHIQKAGQGEVYIWIADTPKHYELHFKDTSTGIPSQDLKHIFKQFYTKITHGSGMGLSFCKTAMQKLHGNIKCFSKEGEFTEFVLSFSKRSS